MPNFAIVIFCRGSLKVQLNSTCLFDIANRKIMLLKKEKSVELQIRQIALSVLEIRSRSYSIINHKYRFVFLITAISAVPDQHLSLKN